jgi:tRNA A-37 threonylcarbamoyl transferase component Bud32
MDDLIKKQQAGPPVTLDMIRAVVKELQKVPSAPSGIDATMADALQQRQQEIVEALAPIVESAAQNSAQSAEKAMLVALLDQFHNSRTEARLEAQKQQERLESAVAAVVASSVTKLSAAQEQGFAQLRHDAQEALKASSEQSLEALRKLATTDDVAEIKQCLLKAVEREASRSQSLLEQTMGASMETFMVRLLQQMEELGRAQGAAAEKRLASMADEISARILREAACHAQQSTQAGAAASLGAEKDIKAALLRVEQASVAGAGLLSKLESMLLNANNLVRTAVVKMPEEDWARLSKQMAASTAKLGDTFTAQLESCASKNSAAIICEVKQLIDGAVVKSSADFEACLGSFSEKMIELTTNVITHLDKVDGDIQALLGKQKKEKYFLKNVRVVDDSGAINSGGQGTIYPATYGGAEVVAKRWKRPATKAAAAVQDKALEIIVYSMEVRHPNIIEHYGFTQHGGEYYLIMARGGQSLRQLLAAATRTGSRLHPDLVAHLAHGMACGLLHLHDKNMHHGDIKPDNVVLSFHSPPSSLLIDFDLARNELEAHQTSSGTFAYLSSEIRMRHATEGVFVHSMEGDVFSFGITIHDLRSTEGLSVARRISTLTRGNQHSVHPRTGESPYN